MGFNEKVHAYIAAKFYVHLTEHFGERGKKAFTHATQYYAEQRGRRMAQRAIRDGRQLDYGTYMEYGEWVNTEEIINEGCANKSEILSVNPDYEIYITRCPWHTQFKEMGLVEAGHTYCEDLDSSICRGFNPHLTYLVYNTLHKSDHCKHVIKNVCFQEGEKHPKRPEGLFSFEFHCAHSFWAYAEVTEAIFKAEGKEVVGEVMRDFTKEYGQEMADTIMNYKYTNFNDCD